jgi:hypothetical protein
MRASVTVDGKRYEFSIDGSPDFFEFSIDGKPVFSQSLSQTASGTSVTLGGPIPITGTATVELAYEPTSSQVAAFIEGLDKPAMSHTVADIASHFLRRTLNSKNGDRQVYNRLLRHLRTAQRMLGVKYGGRFERKKQWGPDARGRRNVFSLYSFKPSVKHVIYDHPRPSESIMLAEEAVAGGNIQP